ncbi:hypothetical protein BOX15_Mlig019072g2 [Macrostomum lignano]|uniref:Uncharacterized protein n=1 Tax=Macrostomum lignano TaxID=282301 RepID=A0A267G4B3_9PLAT|nr:hypothetical protein BOX15_Mlig019072g2 [Macrostomum lignano]
MMNPRRPTVTRVSQPKLFLPTSVAVTTPKQPSHQSKRKTVISDAPGPTDSSCLLEEDYVVTNKDPELDVISDASLRTVRCASDRVSSDTLRGLVSAKAASGEASSAGEKLLVQQSLWLQQWSSKLKLNSKDCDQRQRPAEQEKDIPIQKSLNNYTKRSVHNRKQQQQPLSESESPKQHRDSSHQAADSTAAAASAAASVEQLNLSCPSRTEYDLSLLLQALFGHVYGSDSQRVLGSSSRLVEAAGANCDSADSAELMLPAPPAVLLDRLDDSLSEFLTLTCGDASQTLLTELCRQIQGQPPKLADSPKTSATGDKSNNKDRASSLRLKKGQSSMSAVGSEQDQTLAATALQLPPPDSQFSAIMEAIPPSDRLGKKVDEQKTNAGDTTALSIGSTKNEIVTVESKVELDVGDCSKPDQATSLGRSSNRSNLSASNVKSRNRVARRQHWQDSPTLCDPSLSVVNDSSRFAYLRTPEPSVQPACNSDGNNDDAASSFTAAMVEWDDQKRRAYNSSSQRRRRSGSRGRDKKSARRDEGVKRRDADGKSGRRQQSTKSKQRRTADSKKKKNKRSNSRQSRSARRH